MSRRNASVEDILDELEGETRGSGDPTLGTLVDAIDNRGFAPFFVILPLAGLTPLAAIPSVPTILAVMIGLLAVQMVMGRDHLWLPEWLRKRRIDSDRMTKSTEKLRPVAERLDRWLGRRLSALTGPRSYRVAGALIVLLCVPVPPLELLPGAAALPMLAIALFGLALFFKDGIVMLVAYVVAAAAFLSLWGLL